MRSPFLQLLGVGLAAATARSAHAVDDVKKYEFDPRPAPPWVEMIDQGERDASLAGIKTPKGIGVEIVAREPTVVNPVDLSFDEQGRPYVIEWRPAPESHLTNYEVHFHDGTSTTIDRMAKPSVDCLKALSDDNGDGLYETSRVVLDGLEMTSTAVFLDDWVYLPSVGHVLRSRVAADGSFGKPEEIVRGLCGFHHHQVSGVAQAIDGSLYVTSGDDDNRGEGSDGSRAIVLRCGAVLRMQPDGSQLAEFARGFRNPYRNVAFDDVGNVFHSDNDQEDGSKFQGVRLLHILEGADYGWRLLPGAVCCQTDFQRGLLAGEWPGRMGPMLKTGRGAPAGLLIYQGEQFPESFRGLFIYPDAYRQVVRAYRVEAAGSTFRIVEEFVLMKSDDELFRPCQAVAGPDGAIYVVDWRTGNGGAGQLWGDGVHGRVYRLKWTGANGVPAIPLASMDRWAKLAAADDDELLRHVDGKDFELRRRALNELAKRGPAARQKLLALARDAGRSDAGRIAAFGGASRSWANDVTELAVSWLGDDSPDVRRTAVEALGRHLSANGEDFVVVAPRVMALLNDESPAVRRAAAIAVGRAFKTSSHPDERRGAATAIWQRASLDRTSDAPLFDGFAYGLELLGADGIAVVVEQLENTSPELRELAVAFVQSFRTRAAADALDGLLAHPPSSLTNDQTIRLLQTYRHILVDPPIRADGVVAWLARHPGADAELQLTALETVGLVGSSDSHQLTAIAEKLLATGDAALRRRVIESIGRAELNACSGVLGARLRDPRWPVDERRAILQTLSRLRARAMPFGAPSTAPGVETVLDDVADVVAHEPDAGLRIDALTLLAEVDFARCAPLARQLLASGDLALEAAAVNALAADAGEAERLGQEFVGGTLDRALLPSVADSVRRHAAIDPQGKCAALLKQIMQGALAATITADQAARIESLVAQSGDPVRGRKVFFDSRSQCASCHQLEGHGSQVGPDLTRVWETHTPRQLVESILEPSRVIKEGFGAWNAVTVDGKVYAGLKVSQTADEIVLRDAAGRTVRIPASDVDQFTPSEQSLMPAGVASQLPFQEFVDLIAFLKDRAAQEALRSMPRAASEAKPADAP